SRDNVYFLPGDFFINFSDNITRQIWLNSVPKINPYFIPAGYFENLSEVVLDKLAINSNELISSQGLYSVPDGYFNNLAENVLEKIKVQNNSVQQELEELSPLLSKIPKTNVYTVPAEYLESFTVAPFKRETQPAKIISIKRKPRRWIAYAAAACIAALLFGGGYYYMQGNTFNNNNSTAQSSVADPKVQQGIAQLSDAEIDNYLNNDNTDVSTPQGEPEDINIKSLLENMSDEEINNYLRENPDPDENTKGI
ncbi:MAG TPA: hypothetical protein VGI61_05990, partial [Parafilimonas sp.]